MEDELRVADLMTGEPVAVSAEDPVSEVYELMTKHAVRHIPVTDRDGNVEGIVSHRDLVRGILCALDDLSYSEQHMALKSLMVREFMTPDPELISPDATLREAARILIENKFGCLPVTEGTLLVGIITEADFVKHYMRASVEGKGKPRQLAASSSRPATQRPLLK